MASSIADTTLKPPPPAQRYGLAVVSVAAALGAALVLNQYNVRDVEFPLFLFAIAVSPWYAGPAPGILALVLSSLAFNYSFTEPLYSFYVARTDVPYLVLFILFASGLVQRRSAPRRATASAIERSTGQGSRRTYPAGRSARADGHRDSHAQPGS